MNTLPHPAVELVQLPLAAINALANGDLETANRHSPVPLTRHFSSDRQVVWKIRSLQLATAPDDGGWVTGAIIDRASGQAVGCAGFHGRPDGAGMVEVGYSVDPAFRRRGYARAALELLLARAAAEPAARVVRATISPENEASRNLVLQYGFKEKGSQWDEEDRWEIIFEAPSGRGLRPPAGPVISETLFAQQATLTTARLRLEPLGPEHFEAAWASLQDPEAMRLTGTHADFTPDQIRDWLAGLAERHDRGDWAVIRLADGDDADEDAADGNNAQERYLGEVVLNDLDPDNASVGFRIVLSPSEVLGQGYGTEATRAVVAHAFDDLGLHRVALEVFAFNPRAQRAYEKAGFSVEGRQREALWWDGEWVDTVSMGILAGDPRP